MNSAYDTPKSDVDKKHNQMGTQSLLLIATRQKNLLLTFFVYILIVGFGATVTPEIKTLVQLAQIFIMLVIVFLTARLSFCLYGKVGATIMTILSIIPIINIIIILITSSKATKIIKTNGFKSGLMGADINAIKNKKI